MENAVVLFDGVCHLCQRAVRFIIKRDSAAFFRFASLQSAVAQELLPPAIRAEGIPASVVLVYRGRIYTQSSAALHIARRLDGGWPLFFAAIIIPPVFRNAVYAWIARNRYRLFGRSETCWLPSADLQHRFL